MKITWEFNPDRDEDTDRLLYYENARKAMNVIRDMREWLQGKIKYAELFPQIREAYESVQAEFNGAIDENKLPEALL